NTPRTAAGPVAAPEFGIGMVCSCKKDVCSDASDEIDAGERTYGIHGAEKLRAFGSAITFPEFLSTISCEEKIGAEDRKRFGITAARTEHDIFYHIGAVGAAIRPPEFDARVVAGAKNNDPVQWREKKGKRLDWAWHKVFQQHGAFGSTIGFP